MSWSMLVVWYVVTKGIATLLTHLSAGACGLDRAAAWIAAEFASPWIGVAVVKTIQVMLT